MTVYSMPVPEAFQWIAYTARTDEKTVYDWVREQQFTKQQVLAIGSMLRDSPIINLRPKHEGKWVTFTCQGCGEEHRYFQKTKPRKWCSDACRMRHYRRRKNTKKRA